MLQLVKHSYVAQLLTFAVALGSSACGSAIESESGTEAVDSVGEALSVNCAPTVDPTIAVPAGHRLAFSLDATGVQIYACQVSATGHAWVLQAPEADLFNPRGRSVGTHYVGPTWEYRDASSVKASRVAGVSPDPSSIPWLLLAATTHAGTGKMAEVTYIQRLDTVAGLAPAAATCNADHIGEVARSDYAAVYHFFEAGAPPCGCAR
jgi:FtsP/CotA-like multicopper oxidase with cupredoxin domain